VNTTGAIVNGQSREIGNKTQDEDKENNSTTQYGLDTTKHKTQDDDKQNKKHNTICFGHHQTQDTRR
jgi:hypothetical protein